MEKKDLFPKQMWDLRKHSLGGVVSDQEQQPLPGTSLSPLFIATYPLA